MAVVLREEAGDRVAEQPAELPRPLAARRSLQGLHQIRVVLKIDQRDSHDASLSE